ncbi:Putative sterol transport protein NPC2 [Septoria linicola]|uniref:Phosphatidylglycerol/phosphatidylinositol transfer protein n=1 Tax=Septoria linicola TaxID=215465 RepID=A0A9Q9AZ52_9PEZI|nr:Putative sterol transport protein NPC2 [Septoria linicola]
MKLLSILSSALLATAVTARSTIHKRDDTNLSVPGDNPLEHCKDPKDDILAIKKVDLDPNPPKAGTTLQVTASGVLAEDVEEGAKVHLAVKYGLITIIRQEADLCDTVKKADLECPLKKGDLKLSKDVDLPAQIPPGKYSVEANVVSKDGKDITCLKATVQFSRGGVMGTGLFKEGL